MKNILRAFVPVTSVALLSWSTSAQACGGLFCSNATPVNQVAERIVFAQDEDGTTTQIVEIMYEGPAERFAWVLPVPGVPDVGVSSKEFLNAVQGATNPIYRLNSTFAQCDFGDSSTGGASASFGSGGTMVSGNAPSVVVLDQGTVGPFDYETISVRAADDDAATVAIEWLEDNDYDLGDLGADVLRPYLQNGLNLMAFRLTKGNDAGSIRPVTLTYESNTPAIPIRPTAVAAQDDMGILVWVLGKHRAIPTDYRGLVLNEALINWVNPGSNYDELVSLAADEAGGQGFVTEYAQPTEELDLTNGFSLPTTSQYESNPVWALRNLSFAANRDGVRDAIRPHLELPEGITLDEFLACTDCYFQESSGMGGAFGTPTASPDDPVLTTNWVAMNEALREQVLDPLEHDFGLFSSYDYVTRLYTTMSAGDMTKDPVFDFNPDIETVSNLHVLEREFLDCGNSWRITLSNGDVVTGSGGTWPITAADGVPANDQILQFSTSGAPEIIQNNDVEIRTALSALPSFTPAEEVVGGGGASGNSPDSGDDGGCSWSPAPEDGTNAPWLATLLGTLYWLRRRTSSAIRG